MNNMEDKKLIQLLTEASEAYYNTDKKIISDEEFDKLELEYQKRFGKKFIGANPPINKGQISIEHDYANLVGTLSKNNTIDQFMEWYSKAVSKLPTDKLNLDILITLKYDGNSIVSTYKNGTVIKTLTRGKNGKGLDLTRVFKDYHTLEYIKDECGIKYEVIMKYDDFENLLKKENSQYANPRSVVAGKLDCDDARDYTQYFTLIPLWLNYKNKEITRYDEISDLEKEFGNEYADNVTKYSYIINYTNLDEVKSDITEVYNTIIGIREDLPFMIDGIVIEFLDPNVRKILGMNTGFPNWATALKFPYMEKRSVVTGFDYCLGDSRRITPRVYFKEVSFNGTKHSKQSLQNYKRLKELNLRKGSDILVQYRNDCLTYIERLDTENNKELDKTPMEDIYCPECGEKAILNDNETYLFCPNEKCPGKIPGIVQNFLVKMDIKGIKRNMINAMKEAGLLNSIEDLYTMNYSKIANIDRMGEKVAENVKSAIQNKVPYDSEILGAMGIENCSLLTARDICSKYSLKELLEIDNLKETLMDIDGISEITANYIEKGLEENKDTIEFLLKRKHKVYKEKNNVEIKEVVVFTGFRDKDLQEKLEEKGYVFKSSVTKNTTLLVCKDINSSSSNIEKAKKYGTRIISKEEFMKEV